MKHLRQPIVATGKVIVPDEARCKRRGILKITFTIVINNLPSPASGLAEIALPDGTGYGLSGEVST